MFVYWSLTTLLLHWSVPEGTTFSRFPSQLTMKLWGSFSQWRDLKKPRLWEEEARRGEKLENSFLWCLLKGHLSLWLYYLHFSSCCRPPLISTPAQVPLHDSNLNSFSIAFSLRTSACCFLQPSVWLCGFLPHVISSGLTHYSLVSQLFTIWITHSLY